MAAMWKDFANRDRHIVTAEIFDSLERWVVEGIPTGGFLHRVLMNDLHGAAITADFVNTSILSFISQFVVKHVPIQARGNDERMREWRGLKSLPDDHPLRDKYGDQ